MSVAVDERRPTVERVAVAIGLAGAALLSLATCLRRVWAADVWWQARTGRYVLEQGWPDLDPFSYVAAAPWIELVMSQDQVEPLSRVVDQSRYFARFDIG